MITLINNITDAILSTDEHGIINTYNSAALIWLIRTAELTASISVGVLNLETTDKKAGEAFKGSQVFHAIRQWSGAQKRTRTRC